MRKVDGMMERMEEYAVRARIMLPGCHNEAQTKATLIDPYLELLGYDTKDPEDVRHEMSADINKSKRSEKVDYALIRNGEPWMLIEAKTASKPLKGAEPPDQLLRYVRAKLVRYAALTNGRTWRWFRRSKDDDWRLEDTPFLEHDVCAPSWREVDWLSAIHQIRCNGDDEALLDDAELRCRSGRWLEMVLSDPSDDVLKFMLNDMGYVRRGRMKMGLMGDAKEALRDVVKYRDDAIRTEASRCLQGDGMAEKPEEPAPKQARTDRGGRGKRWNFRYRVGGGQWTYCNNATAVCLDVMALLVVAVGVEKVRELCGLGMRGPMPLEDLPKRYHMIPETAYAINTNKNKEILIGSIRKAMPHIARLEVETDGGDRNDSLREEEWSWKSIDAVEDR